MNRRNFITTAAGSLSLAAAADPKPNIIFILADDLGWGDTGCYGNRSIKTPNIDRLAQQGTLFEQFYVNSPVCSPSRTAFMTGQYPARYRMHSALEGPAIDARRGMPEWLDPKAPFLPRVLKQAGYTTAHFGKWHLGSGPGAPKPEEYGIDQNRTVNSNGNVWADQNDPFFRARSSKYIAEESIGFIEHNRDRPFYLNFWSLVPHATLNPTEEQMKPYARFGPPGVPHKGAMQIFYASVSDLDQQIGRLLTRLDELNLTRNTIVLFSSDNGPEDIHISNASHSGVGSPGPFRGRKRSLYEGGVRSPFLVRWPGHVPAGRVEDSIVTGVDFLPTMCALAGVTSPATPTPDGEDRSSVLLGKPSERTKSILREWRLPIQGDIVNRSPRLAVRKGNWKLLLNPDRSRIELYNIPEDPTELRNLAERHPDIVEKLSAEALAWQKTLPVGPVDPGAGRNDYPWPHSQGKARTEPRP